MTAPEPAGLSVVVPTFGSPESVERLLASLASAVRRLPAGVPTETIVVDDSTPDAARAIAERCRRHGVQYVRGPRRVGAKRNLGTRLARYPIVFYIDSDCVADPDVLRGHLDAHQAYRGRPSPSGRPVGAVAGPTLVVGAETAPAWRVVAPSLVVNSCWSWPARFSEVWWAATANLSVRREAFDRAGGFDNRTWTVVGGEDVDFGVRLGEAGYATVCRADAVVRHATDGITTLREFRAKMFRYGRACVYNCARQPQHAGWSANPVSLAVAGAAAGLAVRLVSGRAASSARRAGGWLAAGALGAAAVAFAVRAGRESRRHGMSIVDAVGMVSVDWAFHAGITAEAVYRSRPAAAFQRYDYFPPRRFHANGDPTDGEV